MLIYRNSALCCVKVANSDVRANAACLFLDAFPLQDNECSREERDAILQKQFDFLKVCVCVCVCVCGVHVHVRACVRMYVHACVHLQYIYFVCANIVYYVHEH